MWLRAPGTKDVGDILPHRKKPLEEENEDWRGKQRWQMPVPSLPSPAEILHGNPVTTVCTKPALTLATYQAEGTHLLEGKIRGLYKQERRSGHVCRFSIAGLYPSEVRMHLLICTWLVETSPVDNWSGENPLLGPVRVWWKGSLRGFGCLLAFLSGWWCW